MRGLVSIVLGLGLCAAIVARPSPAHADPAAEALFREGRDLIKAGKLDEACDRFQRSRDLERKVGTLLNLGDCREQQGHVAAAWDAFTEAVSVAARDADDLGGAEAKRRADALVPKLSYLTITVMGDRPPGLAITRNGQPVAEAIWNAEVPVDPGPQELAATAPGRKPWSMHLDLAVGAHGATTVQELAIDPAAVVEPPPEPERPRALATPPLSPFGFGLAFGGTSDSDIVGGLRVQAGYPLPRGAVRAIVQGLYTRYSYDPPYQHTNLYAIGLSFDYLYPWGKGLASAAGLGVGIDIVDDNWNEVSTDNWAVARASPLIVRLANPRLEIGLHLELVVPQKVFIGLVGVDWFL